MNDAFELAAHFADSEDEETIEKVLNDTYGIGFNEFSNLVADLAKMIDIGESPFTKKMYKGFSIREGNRGTWLYKIEA